MVGHVCAARLTSRPTWHIHSRLHPPSASFVSCSEGPTASGSQGANNDAVGLSTSMQNTRAASSLRITQQPPHRAPRIKSRTMQHQPHQQPVVECWWWVVEIVQTYEWTALMYLTGGGDTGRGRDFVGDDGEVWHGRSGPGVPGYECPVYVIGLILVLWCSAFL